MAALTTFAATATLAIAIQNTIGNDLRPLTGYQYVQKGAEYMDRTLEILESDVGRSENWAVECERFTQRYQKLQKRRNELLDTTMTVIGSLWWPDWNKGRIFHAMAYDLLQRTKKSSQLRITTDIRAESVRRIMNIRERSEREREEALALEHHKDQEEEQLENHQHAEDTARKRIIPAPVQPLIATIDHQAHSSPGQYYLAQSSDAQNKLSRFLPPPQTAYYPDNFLGPSIYPPCH